MTIYDCITATADHFSIRVDCMMADRRFEGVARARQVAQWLATKMCETSVIEIGAAFRRDHTTVAHNIRLVDRLISIRDPWGIAALALLDKMQDGDGADPPAPVRYQALLGQQCVLRGRRMKRLEYV